MNERGMAGHLEAHANQELWDSLHLGDLLEVIKLSPEGEAAARYEATVVAREPLEGWIALRARWTYHHVALDGLEFVPGDTLIEWFSPLLPFNAFAVLSPADELRGWYANVTHPAYLLQDDQLSQRPSLFWHDLYLDLVGLPGGEFVLRDEDELDASGLATRDALLHETIVAAGQDLSRRFRRGMMPFRLPAHAAILEPGEPGVPE